MDRWAFRTNVTEWLLTIPNFQIAYDLSDSQYNNQVALLGLKYNWNTPHTFVPYYVFNVMDIRPEYRRYFRQTQRKSSTVKVDDGVETIVWEKIDLLSPKRKNPKPEQAWYYGLYSDFTTYSIKPGSTGRQGWAVGVGVSAGYEVPLYEYNTGAVDIDLGLSAGLVVTANKAYSSGNDLYAYDPVPSRDCKFLPLPMLTEVRVALAWRHTGVGNKYDKVDPSLEIYAQTKSIIDADAAQSSKKDFDDTFGDIQMATYQRNDSLYMADYAKYLEPTMESRRRYIEGEAGLSLKQKDNLYKYMDKRFQRLKNDFAAAIKDFHLQEDRAKAEKEKAARAAKAEEEKAARKAEADKAKAEAEKAKAEAQAAKTKEEQQ